MRKALILFAAVALLAGCGGGGGKSGSGGGGKPSGPPLTKAAYQAKLQSISKEIGQSFRQSITTGKFRKDDVEKGVTFLREFADRLREVNPPAGVKEVHARLIKAMNDLAADLPAIAKKLNALKGSNDISAGIKALFGDPAVAELVKVGNDFKKAGYNLNLNGS